MKKAQELDGKYLLTKEDIKSLGGVWNDDAGGYVFPDHSVIRFTDIRNGAQEDKLHVMACTFLYPDCLHPEYEAE